MWHGVCRESVIKVCDSKGHIEDSCCFQPRRSRHCSADWDRRCSKGTLLRTSAGCWKDNVLERTDHAEE